MSNVIEVNISKSTVLGFDGEIFWIKNTEEPIHYTASAECDKFIFDYIDTRLICGRASIWFESPSELERLERFIDKRGVQE